MNDKLVIGGHEFDSRFILGSCLNTMLTDTSCPDCQAGAEMITLGCRKANRRSEYPSVIPDHVTLLLTSRRECRKAVRIAGSLGSWAAATLRLKS